MKSFFAILKQKHFYLFVYFAAFAACTKIDTTTLGSGLIPPIDGILTKDTTLDIIAKNTNFDTVAVGIADDHIIGYINDPVFGKTQASVAAQFMPPYFKYQFPVGKDSLHIDSVVLSLGYRGFYGDSTRPVSLRVFRIEGEQIFRADSIYKNYQTIEKGLELTEYKVPKTFFIRQAPFDSSYFNNIRIRLDSSYGTELLKNYDTTTAYANDSLFSAYIKGLVIESELNGNTLIRTNLLDTGTKLILYYRYDRKDSVGKKDTTYATFNVNSFVSAHSNTILRDRTGSEMAQYLPANSNSEDDKIFLQSGPGSYATLKIKGLEGLPNMIVHRAEIIMDQIPDYTSNSDDLFSVPNLFLSGINDSNRFAIPPSDPFEAYTFPSPVVSLSSQGISNLSSFGCFPKSKIDATSGKQVSYYTFDISRYVQSVTTRNIDTIKFALWAPYGGYIRGSATSLYYYPISSSIINFPGIGRVRLGGGNNAEHKMRLHIIYSVP